MEAVGDGKPVDDGNSLTFVMEITTVGLDNYF